MLTALGITYSIIVVVVAIGCWIGSALGLPALWLMVLLSALNAWLMPEDYMARLPWWSVFVLAGIAGIGELIEFATSALGVGKLGGTRRATILALVGSILGAIVGFFISLPIPIVGPIVGTILFSGVGALVGAWFGEYLEGTETKKSIQIGIAAFVGRILGTVGKSMCGAVMVVLVVLLAFQ
jgi:uncharacterized protein YqgC (DUF456 family)